MYALSRLTDLPLCCRYMDMESFALEADAKGAVVMLALHGGLQANGAVQRFLEEMDVPFTGPSWQSAYLCGNQVSLPLCKQSIQHVCSSLWTLLALLQLGYTHGFCFGCKTDQSGRRIQVDCIPFGMLQCAVLEHFTSPILTVVLGVQEWMAEALAELEVHNISTAPKFGISYSSLKDAATSQAACEHLFEQMKDAVGQSLTTCLRPSSPYMQPLLYTQLWCLLPHRGASRPLVGFEREAWAMHSVGFILTRTILSMCRVRPATG